MKLKMNSSICDKINKSIHYFIICDSTPDISQQEQNVLIIRCVRKNEGSRQGSIQERFIISFLLLSKI
ncbi:hypothetical protein PR048_020399 [Dryococelus australis]|uniref:Ribosomal protein S15 n=1 Tax=Dryococelus australis TaxID=614101 RepID=A0ABQ9H686_9NEOP|nr:hypothetical protein PR048_020399 [Dryococelus australis]